MIPTDEQIKEAAVKMQGRNRFSDLPFFNGAKFGIEQMKEELTVELGKCECGQEHDIRFMASDSEGNHICFECYRSWVGEFSVHVRKLLKIRANGCAFNGADNPLVYNELIDKIGENYTNVGEGWKEHVNEDWEDEA